MCNLSISCLLPHSLLASHAVFLQHPVLIYVSGLVALLSAVMPHRDRSPQDSSADPFFEDTYAISHSESQENASRLMDDLELLRAERLASNQEKQEASRPRSKSLNRRHHPEAPPEDAFDTLTSQPQIPQTKADKKPTLVRKLFNSLKRFPRAVRYFVYVCTDILLVLIPSPPPPFPAPARLFPSHRPVFAI